MSNNPSTSSGESPRNVSMSIVKRLQKNLKSQNVQQTTYHMGSEYLSISRKRIPMNQATAIEMKDDDSTDTMAQLYESENEGQGEISRRKNRTLIRDNKKTMEELKAKFTKLESRIVDVFTKLESISKEQNKINDKINKIFTLMSNRGQKEFPPLKTVQRVRDTEG